MSNVVTFLLIALGVAISVLYPVILGNVRKAFPQTAGNGLGRNPGSRSTRCCFSSAWLHHSLSLRSMRPRIPHAKLKWYAALLLGIGWEAINT